MRRAVWVVGVLGLLLVAPASPAWAQCDSATQYTYTFTNLCAEPVWLGQRSTGDAKAYPPQSGSWAIAGSCTSDAQCSSGACDTGTGQCTCATSADCGGAPCGGDDKCMTTASVCVPQNWSSGTFWPRTGCTLDATVSPETLTCTTGGCFATNNDGTQLLDCSVGNGGGSPSNPVTQFEVTSSSTAVNYDVSLAAGYNVETKAVPVGGGQVVPGTPSTDVIACYDVGCTADLNDACPAPLQVVENGSVIGCLDPCTRCQRPDPPAALQCDDTLPDQWTCPGTGSGTGSVTYLDLYCAKNTVDGTAQASPNQGTPTAFSQLDCPPVTTFVQPTFAGAYSLPPGQGVCIYANPPQSTTPGFNDYKWDDFVNGNSVCGAGMDGTPCGGYRTKQSDDGYYTDALGYTCQTATIPVSGGTQTAYLCMPPRTSGLGTCTSDTEGGLTLYSAAGGVTNPSWIWAATQAGGGTPYYVPFKTACQAAYAWQYDDIASGFACTPTSAVSGGSTFSGFAVTFCASGAGPGPGPGPGPSPVALTLRGHAARLGKPDRGLLRLKGKTTVPTSIALEDMTFTVDDLLDAIGDGGEMVGTPLPLGLTPKKRKKKVAIFTSEAGSRPRLKVVLHRPRPDSENVKLHVLVRKATIGRPSSCDAGDSATLETAFTIGAGSTAVRAGTIDPWRCKKKALHVR